MEEEEEREEQGIKKGMRMCDTQAPTPHRNVNIVHCKHALIKINWKTEMVKQDDREKRWDNGPWTQWTMDSLPGSGIGIWSGWFWCQRRMSGQQFPSGAPESSKLNACYVPAPCSSLSRVSSKRVGALFPWSAAAAEQSRLPFRLEVSTSKVASCELILIARSWTLGRTCWGRRFLKALGSGYFVLVSFSFVRGRVCK